MWRIAGLNIMLVLSDAICNVRSDKKGDNVINGYKSQCGNGTYDFNPKNNHADTCANTDRTLKDSISELDLIVNWNLKHLQKRKRHKKRNPVNLYYMVECATKCNPWHLLDYGNYCGYGGSGRAVNSIDRCCQEHDNCYEHVLQTYECWRFNVYLIPYSWSCRDQEPYCSQETNTCRREICYCDRDLTECLNRAGCP